MAKKPFITPKLTTYEDILGLNNVSKEEIVYIPYEYLHRSPFQYRDIGLTPAQIQDQVLKLAFDVKVDGKIQQPCIVRYKKERKETDYELVVGHNRTLVAKYLTEVEKLEGYREVPCIIRELSDAQAEYLCNSSNNLRPKTDYEIMHELETKMRLLKERPEDFPHLQGPGRMVEKLAQEMYLSKSTAGEYLQISKNLSDNAKKSFATGELNKSAAVAMASLPHTEQDALIDAGMTKQKDIKTYKEEKIEKTVHRTTITDTVKTVKTHNIEEQNADNAVKDPAVVVDVLPGQYRVANTDMELEEIQISDINLTRESESDITDEGGTFPCPRCARTTRMEHTFVFRKVRYCTNCLNLLICEMARAGVIIIDGTSPETNGIIIHS